MQIKCHRWIGNRTLALQYVPLRIGKECKEQSYVPSHGDHGDTSGLSRYSVTLY